MLELEQEVKVKDDHLSKTGEENEYREDSPRLDANEILNKKMQQPLTEKRSG